MHVAPEIETPQPDDAGWVTRLAPDGPQLAVRWTKPRENFRSSVRAIFSGPSAPRKFLGAPYFRDCWIEPRWPLLAFLAALVLEIVFIATVHPRWNFTRPNSSVGPELQLTWYQPPADDAPDAAPDLPALSPASLKPKKRAPSPAAPPDAQPSADAFHPRQNIWSDPLVVNHPRQELLEPDAPPTPPKILPVLPNIVQWSDDDSAHPKLRLAPNATQRMQPANAPQNHAADIAAPDLSHPESPAGPIDIAPSALDAKKPAMSVPAMSQARAASPRSNASAAAPEIGPNAASDGGRIVALSATPGPAAPPPAVPQGNLSAHISMGPDGRRGSTNGAAGSVAGSGAGKSGPENIGISKSGELPDAPVASISGPSGSRGAGRGGSGAASADPEEISRASISANRPAASPASPASAATLKAVIASGARPEALLGTNEIHTLRVNMPNLASATGDWTLSFAELGAPEQIPDGRPQPADSGLLGPVPLRKVDPKYPPELKSEKVEGEVVLYAIIRKDGSVDSIQLVHGLDPQLDENAMEALARWKFQPGQRHGVPVELAAIVRIPFHAPPPEPVY
jgi:TonB family protein